MLNDAFWCSECGLVDEWTHRCQKWSSVTRIPAKAVIALIDAYVLEELNRAAERALEAMWMHDWNAGNLSRHVSDAILGGRRKAEGARNEAGN